MPARRRRATVALRYRLPALVLSLPLSGALLLPAASALAQPAPAQQAAAVADYAIPAGPLTAALNRFAAEAGIFMAGANALTAGKHSPGLQGRYGVQEALEHLLADSGLEAVAGSAGTYTLRPAATTLRPVKVSARADAGALPPVYAGGQVARGARLGIAGNVDFMDTPFSLQSFTRQYADDVQARTVSDVAKYDASVRSSQASPIAQNDNLYIRGFQTVAGQGAFDGVPNLLNRTPPLDAFERIEVLKGPSAFLNGRPGNVGGTINVVPKRAGNTPLARLTLRYESDSVFGVHVDAGSRFGVDQAWGLRVNAAYSDGETALKPSARRQSMAAAALDYRGDSVRVYLDLIQRDSEHSPTIGEAVQLAAGVDVPRAPDADKLFTQPWTRFDNRTTLAVARAEWDFARGWTALFTYGHTDVAEQQISHVYRVNDNSGTTRTNSLGASDSPADQGTAELMLRGEFHTGALRHRLVAGISRTDYRLDNLYRPLPDIYTANLYAPVYAPKPFVPAGYTQDERSDTVIEGGFIGDEIAFLDERLLVNLGARYTRIDVERVNRINGVEATPYRESELSPAFGVVFKLRDNVSLYGNYIEALEQGGTAPTAASNRGDTLPPLVSEQIEAGVKMDFGSYAATAALFEINKASEYLDSAGRYGQDGEQVNRGAELNLFGEPWRGVRVFGGATWIDAEMRRTASAALDGKTAIGVPRFVATASAEWDVPWLRGLAVNGGAVHVGKQYYDNANLYSLPAWTRLDAGVRYAFEVAGKAAVLRLNVENLSDRNYWGHNDRGRIYLAPPRTVLLSGSVDF